MAQHKLVIAEKPSVAQSLAAVIGATVRKDGYLEGNGWRVSWCVGHLAGLADADSYDPKYAKWRYDDLLLSLQLGLDERLVRNDHVAELLVDLHHLELHGLVYIYVVVANGLHVDLRTGQERLDAEHVDDHTALRAALDVTLDDLVVGQRLVDAIPRFELTRLLVRKRQLAVLVLGRLHVDLDLLAYGQFGVVAEFGNGNDALALVADVDDNLALADAHDRALDHLADGDVRQRLVVSGGDLLLRLGIDAQIVLERVPVEVLVRDYSFVLFHNGNSVCDTIAR